MKKMLLAIFIISCSVSLPAQQKKALIIGIDNYTPPADAKPSKYRQNWPVLEGSKNDALAIKDAIIARYGFDQKDIKELYNNDATRDNILNGMKALLASSKSGDIAFIFYAGHGSQVHNSLSSEPGHLDQSMVPVNTWEPGVGDIRDKELGKIFNDFVDKGVVLTVIYDCCHAANMSRGINDMPKLRYIETPDYDSKDSSSPANPASKPGSRFLMLAACQAYQSAAETVDDFNKPHGAFTLGLLNAMKQLSANGSAIDVFTDARAILKCNGQIQEPSVSGSPERLSGTLFGIGKGLIADKVLVPVMGINDEFVVLQGGLISGLDSGIELKNKDSSIRLRVTEMNGADKCIAVVTSGDIGNVKHGELFEVTNWVSGKKSFLKVYVPATALSYDKAHSIAAVCDELKKNKAIKWVYDMELQDPTVSIFLKDGNWLANTNKGQVKVTGFSAENIAEQFKGASLFINIPPTKELLDSITSCLKDQINVKITNTPAEANYSIIGRINNDTLEYALFNTGALTKDSLETMPACTNFEKLTKSSAVNVAGKLADYAYKLGKMRVWFTLTNPSGNQGFPYAMEIRNKDNKKIDSTVTLEEKITIHIVKQESDINNVWDYSFRYVYIFMINHNGAMKLIYPRTEDGNDINHFPDKTNPKNPDYKIPGIFTIKKPTGTDNYYMFTSTEPLSHYNIVFNQEGVRSGTRGMGDALDDLLNLGNIRTRDAAISTPNDWAIQKVSIKTIYKMTP